MIKRGCSFNRGCKPDFGENDHRSPRNRAQGHGYGQNACGVTSPTSRLQSYKNKKKTDSRAYPIQCLNSLLSSNPGTTLNYILTSHCNWLLLGHAFLRVGTGNVVRITTYPTFLSDGGLELRLLRLEYGALRVRPTNGPWFTGTGPFVQFNYDFCHLSHLFRRKPT